MCSSILCLLLKKTPKDKYVRLFSHSGLCVSQKPLKSFLPWHSPGKHFKDLQWAQYTPKDACYAILGIFPEETSPQMEWLDWEQRLHGERGWGWNEDHRQEIRLHSVSSRIPWGAINLLVSFRITPMAPLLRHQRGCHKQSTRGQWPRRKWWLQATCTIQHLPSKTNDDCTKELRKSSKGRTFMTPSMTIGAPYVVSLACLIFQRISIV